MAVAYDLTPSETRVLAFVLEGKTLSATADLLQISENTVKTHLRNIFAKTGLSRQADLVRTAAEMASPAHA
ncbi:MAG: helix-turn-helix transcriptional regulator [Bauldia sp.]